MPNSMTYGDRQSHNDNHVCELFSDYFGLVYDKDTVDQLDSYLDSGIINGEALANIVVSTDEVLQKIKELDKNNGPGSDSIPAFFVQRSAEWLSFRIHEFAKSLHVTRVKLRSGPFLRMTSGKVFDSAAIAVEPCQKYQRRIETFLPLENI
ncbi:hypothetical protein EVAR_39725_1 [Eumeta japonica]|uniref:Uncharacterized protein n=1 Tax=Eumeta variegata TaxID=151549 RepID=A0A4C1W4U4_EUMVA|nr:hypothetical protein EVAR_39725_1 [Eumeta japonica]